MTHRVKIYQALDTQKTLGVSPALSSNSPPVHCRKYKDGLLWLLS